MYRRSVFPGIAESGIEYKSVYPSGHKTYRVVKGVGRQACRIEAGNITVITLEEARHRAKNLLGQLANGIDPIKARHHPG